MAAISQHINSNFFFHALKRIIVSVRHSRGHIRKHPCSRTSTSSRTLKHFYDMDSSSTYYIQRTALQFLNLIKRVMSIE